MRKRTLLRGSLLLTVSLLIQSPVVKCHELDQNISKPSNSTTPEITARVQADRDYEELLRLDESVQQELEALADRAEEAKRRGDAQLASELEQFDQASPNRRSTPGMEQRARHGRNRFSARERLSAFGSCGNEFGHVGGCSQTPRRGDQRPAQLNQGSSGANSGSQGGSIHWYALTGGDRHLLDTPFMARQGSLARYADAVQLSAGRPSRCVCHQNCPFSESCWRISGPDCA